MDLKRLWDIKLMAITIVVEALDTVTKSLEK